MSLAGRRFRGRGRSSPTVEECKAERDYSLWLVFDDGLEGKVYLGDLVAITDFSAWRDVDHFLRVSIDPDTGTVQWDSGIRLDPAALYKDLASRIRAALH